MQDIRNAFIEKLKNEEFVIDKTGVKTIELVGESYIADEEVIFGTLSMEYAAREVEWYESQSLNVYDLPKTPQIWRQVCDKDGYINSNYGWVIYSKENGEQYKNCIRTLRRDKDSRRAMMIYNRPSMQWEYNQNGMSDFMCTNCVQVLIRNDKLVYVLSQRSADSIFGVKNDLYWARHVQNKLVEDLKFDYPDLTIGNLIHQVGSLHVYSRHFYLIDKNYTKS
jgi:thymidylate synthase